ncbi:MAG: hypothetical protein LBQ12_13540 [Deltaproteobacteria bacterium]|jgi:hypothetical protein|nr:hypothetical protein [Deltaproteobacteria bacterium]
MAQPVEQKYVIGADEKFRQTSAQVDAQQEKENEKEKEKEKREAAKK